MDLLPEPPTARYDVGCADLTFASEMAEAFGSTDVEAVGPERVAISPTRYPVRHLGGIACSWANTEPEQMANGQMNPAHKSVHLQVIPDPENRFNKYATMGYPQDGPAARFGEGSGTGCFGDTGFCSVNVTASGSWMEAYISGLDVGRGASDADALAKARPLITSIVGQIREPSRVEPATSTIDCARVLPVDDVLLGLGVAEGSPVGDVAAGGGGYGLWRASIEYAGAAWCVAGEPETALRNAYVQVLPGGAWVFRSDQGGAGVATGAEPVRIPGASTLDSYLSCTPGQVASCVLDMAVGDDWMQVGLSKPDYYTPATEQDRADVLVLAARVLSNVS